MTVFMIDFNTNANIILPGLGLDVGVICCFLQSTHCGIMASFSPTELGRPCGRPGRGGRAPDPPTKSAILWKLVLLAAALFWSGLPAEWSLGEGVLPGVVLGVGCPLNGDPGAGGGVMFCITTGGLWGSMAGNAGCPTRACFASMSCLICAMEGPVGYPCCPSPAEGGRAPLPGEC